MKIFVSNFFKKSIAMLVAFSFVCASITMLPVNAYAADSSVEKNADVSLTSSRVILTSGSTGTVSGDYTSDTFTTKGNTAQSYGMSYYLSCNSASAVLTLHVYRKSDGKEVGTGTTLTKNDTSASTVLALSNYTKYYFTIVAGSNNSGSTNYNYDFSYNIYYYN